MCNCIEKVKEEMKKLAEVDVKRTQGFQEITDAYFTNAILMMADPKSPRPPFTIPFEVHYTRKGKKSGLVRSYKKKINFMPSHCPVCGKIYSK